MIHTKIARKILAEFIDECIREVIVMDKKTNKGTTEKTQKGMNRTEFAEEYSIETGTQGANKCDKTNKTNKTK